MMSLWFVLFWLMAPLCLTMYVRWRRACAECRSLAKLNDQLIARLRQSYGGRRLD